MRPWTSAIGIVVSSLSGSLAPDCPNERLGTAASDSRRMTNAVWFIVSLQFISFASRLVDDDARYWLTILFLLRRIHAMGRGVHGKAVHQLLYRNVFNLPKMLGIVFLHD